MLSKTINIVRRQAVASAVAGRVASVKPFVYHNVRCFAAEAEGKEEPAASSVPEPTQEELEKGRVEWGIKYNDECLKFEKEWEIIAKAVEEQ